MATKETKKSTSEFFSYMQSRIARLHRRGRFGTCQNYERAYRSLRRFYGDKPLSFRDLDEDLVADYEASFAVFCGVKAPIVFPFICVCCVQSINQR